jgi:hypothetical protein
MAVKQGIARFQISMDEGVFEALEKACDMLGQRKSEVIQDALVAHAFNEWKKEKGQIDWISNNKDTVKEAYPGQTEKVLQTKNRMLEVWGDLADFQLEKMDLMAKDQG